MSPLLPILFAASIAVAGPASRTGGQAGPAADQTRLAAVLAAEANRAGTEEQLRVLADATRDSAPRVQAAAARALGRLERRDVLALLLPLLSARDRDVRSEAANAVAQAFRGEPLAQPAPNEHLDSVLEALLASPPSDALNRAVGRLPYETVDQAKAAEAFLLEALERSDLPASAARGLESLGRIRPRLAPLGPSTIERLRAIAARQSGRTLPADVRRTAMLALVAWQGADARTVEAALTDEEFEVRRLAVLAAAGGGSTLTPEQRLQVVTAALEDRAAQVRLEAVRSWARQHAADRGCGPLVQALSDRDLDVVLAAVDSLGDSCLDDEQITNAVAAEAHTPSSLGAWQREAHALLALAKRSRERAALAMSGFSTHSDWQVRLYAARAAAAMGDVATLRRLAADPDDNVVEATLAPLRTRIRPDSDALLIAALNRRTRTAGRRTPARPYQVYREAALQLKGAAPSRELLSALTGALQRASAERCDTSRDARLALVSRIAELGTSAQVSVLTPLLKDLDPEVANAAAAAIAAWTGRRPDVDPPARRRVLPAMSRLFDEQYLAVEMENGRTFQIVFYADEAPLTKARITSLARQGFYNGLTFHRVVPNFVIQGGSPNANEYCGDCPYMLDEVGLRMNLRGTVGVSTRGRDTGDAQFFVNLVDSPRLDHEYTVFGYVCPGGVDVVDAIQEGARMTRVSVTPGRPPGCPPPR